MKRLLILLAFTCTFLGGVIAQSTRSGTLIQVNGSGITKTADTLTNTDTNYVWNGRTDNYQWNVTMQFKNTQLTGACTPSMVVQGSDDATSMLTGNWYTLKNYTTQTVGLSDTGKVTNTTYLFQIPNCEYKSVRVRTITSGTQTSVTSGSFWMWSPFVKTL